MIPFLQQVAQHYYRTGEAWGSTFVFPNRRSLAFFRKYFSEAMAADPAAKAHWAPEAVTINDFFYRCGGFSETDKVTLILELYDVYKELSPLGETLDDFIFWGDVLLGDFDDVDKYLVDAAGLFANVADFRSLQDTFSYLTPGQEAAIRRFAEHFRGRMPEGDGKRDVKARFLQIWNLLGPLYAKFRERLRAKGLSYEGMVYRDLAEKVKTEPVADVLKECFPRSERFIFIGLNALNACEKQVLARMRDAGMARFVWDFRSDWIRDPKNKSSLFLKDFTTTFRNDFETDPEGLSTPEVEVVSVPSGIGQAKLLPSFLEGCTGDWIRTAVVLPDESLLTPVLSSIPPEVDKVNVTMGCPMRSSALFSLMGQIAAMQIHLRHRTDGWYFYHAQARRIFSGTLFRSLLTKEEAAVADKVVSDAKYYIPAADLAGEGLLSSVFRPVVTEPSKPSASQNAALAAYLLDTVREIASRLTVKGGNMLELDFAKRYYTALRQLSGISLEILPLTWLTLADRMLSTLTVPFNGEPLKGLQVMGPLETRALDFDTVIILSANEGVFPRRSVRESFIPPELRKGFDLPTYEYQDAVWAYYFYRLIQRASKVILVCDSRTEGIRSGEESRYIKQLQYDYHAPIRVRTAVAPVKPVTALPDIEKTPEILSALKSRQLSASSLQTYLACPARFYYQTVLRLSETEDVAESLDGGMFGRVFHSVMQQLYVDPSRTVTADYIEAARKDTARLKDLIDKAVCKELRSIEVAGRDLVTADILLQYVRKTLSRDLEYLREHGADSFRILGLEEKVRTTILGYDFVGFVDRLDRIPGGKIRVLDYKTGRVSDAEMDINDDNVEDVVSRLFGDNDARRPKIALQLYLYDRMTAEKLGVPARDLLNSVYSTSRLMADPVRDFSVSPSFLERMAPPLEALLTEIGDPDVPFRRRVGSKSCEYCPFVTICGL